MTKKTFDVVREFSTKNVDAHTHMGRFPYEVVCVLEASEDIGTKVLPRELREWINSRISTDDYDFLIARLGSKSSNNSKFVICLWFTDKDIALQAKLTWS